MIRRSVALCAALLLLASGTACQRERRVRELVLGYLAKTESLSHTINYSESVKGDKFEVKGQVEDAFRYQTLIRKSRVDVLEHVVDDDTVAVRVMDPSAIPALSEGLLVPSDSPLLTDALRAGGWIIDPAGAPTIKKKLADPDAYPISSPLLDPIEIFTYIRSAIENAADVKQWREDDIEPAYRRGEDHFPKPSSAVERRFDLVRPALPNLLRAGGPSIGPVEPDVFNFRKMAIYVRDERVIRVEEEIAIDDHPEVKEAIEKGRTRVIELVKAIKELRTRKKIKLRKMSATFGALGSKIQVRKPTEGINTSLKTFLGPEYSKQTNLLGFALPPEGAGTPSDGDEPAPEQPTGTATDGGGSDAAPPDAGTPSP